MRLRHQVRPFVIRIHVPCDGLTVTFVRSFYNTAGILCLRHFSKHSAK